MKDDDQLQAKHNDLIASIYAGALDTSKYPDVLRAWDAHFCSLAEKDEAFLLQDFSWTDELIGHFEQAGAVFEKLESQSLPSLATRLRSDAEIAFVVNTLGRIPMMSQAAGHILNCVANTPVAELPFDPASQTALENLRRSAAAGLDQDTPQHTLLRFFGEEGDEPMIFLARIEREDPEQSPHILVRSANATWHPGAEAAMRASFGLTAAETDLVRHLYLGDTIKGISEATGRSQATLRTQLSAALGKIGVKGQPGLARAVAGVNHILNQGDHGTPPTLSKPPGLVSPRQRDRVLSMGENVALHLVESGDLTGEPFFFIQTTTWPTLTNAIVSELAASGVRLISPYRSGLGQTTKMPVSMGPEAWADLYVAALDALGIERLSIGGQCSGGVYAMALARRLGARCKGLLLVDTGAPLETARMVNEMPLAPRRLFLGARFFPAALKTPYRLAAADFYSGPDGHKRGVDYFVDGSPVDIEAVRDPMCWTIVRDNFDYCVRNREQAAKDVSHWARDTSAALRGALSICPVRFLHGAENLVHSAKNLRAFVARDPRTSACIVEGESQLLLYRRPEVFAAEVARACGLAG